LSKQSLKPILEINVAMLFISTSGVLGRYIELDPKLIIALRGVFAALFLGLFMLLRKTSWKIDGKDWKAIITGSVFLGAHWVLYFYALQLSNVAIGMLSIFTYPVITSLLEPIILKTKFQKIHMALAVLVLFGLYLLAPEFDLESDYTLAIILGVISAICYSLRNLIMKTKVAKYPGTTLMWYQIAIISILLIPVFFFANYSWQAIEVQLPWLVLLGLLTTTIGHTMFLSSFKNFSITTASLMSSAQPIYGILLGVIFLEEIPSVRTLIGGALILVSVVVESRRTLVK